jgi:hypothetical protein
MTVTPWEDPIKARKVLTVYPTAKITGEWERTFRAAIAKFNELSDQNQLGVKLESPANVTPPNPKGPGGAEVQFDLGNGRLEFAAEGQKFVAKNSAGNELNFSPFETHGYTGIVKVVGASGPRIVRAFVFMPETPKVQAFLKYGKGPNDYRMADRPVGSGVRLFIAVHEFIHVCGLDNGEHNQQGPDADVFTYGPSVSAGAFDRPEEDKILLHLAHPRPNVFAPPITIKKKVADLIRNNWA